MPKKRAEQEHSFSLKTGKLQVNRPQVAKMEIKRREAETFSTKAQPGDEFTNGMKLTIEKKLKKKEVNVCDSERVPTGILGLDALMGGGFEKDSVNLIGGGAGSGKSILCIQFIVNGIEKFNENAIYISFEESKEKFFKHMLKFGWDLVKYERDNKLVFIQYTPAQIHKVLEEGSGLMEAALEKTKAKRIVVDSLTAFTLLQKDELAKRQSSLQLFNQIQKWNCTALLTAEHESDLDKHASTPVEFEVDGILLLYNIRKGDIRERSLEIFKLRGTKHSAKIFPMKITDNGIIVYPEETIF